VYAVSAGLDGDDAVVEHGLHRVLGVEIGAAIEPARLGNLARQKVREHGARIDQVRLFRDDQDFAELIVMTDCLDHADGGGRVADDNDSHV